MAYATIIAQAVSAILTMIVLVRYDGSIRLELRKLRFHWDMLKKIVSVGIPAALQMAITAFSNVFVQGYINHFGADCMSGWTAYTKVDQLVILPVQSLSMASTTFVGQNLGVGNVARAKGGVRRALLLSFAVTAVLLVPVLLLAPGLTSFFNSKAEVVSYGALLLRLLSPFYFFFCINQIYSGALRGRGQQPYAHVHHAGLLRGIPPDLPVCHGQLHLQRDRAHRSELPRRMVRMQRRHPAVLHPLQVRPLSPGGGCVNGQV